MDESTTARGLWQLTLLDSITRAVNREKLYTITDSTALHRYEAMEKTVARSSALEADCYSTYSLIQSYVQVGWATQLNPLSSSLHSDF